MTNYLIESGRAPTGQGQAAFVKSRPSCEMLAEVLEAVKDARLVGWDLTDVPDLEPSALQEVDRVARVNNTLVVVLAAPKPVICELLTQPFSNIVWVGRDRI